MVGNPWVPECSLMPPTAIIIPSLLRQQKISHVLSTCTSYAQHAQALLFTNYATMLTMYCHMFPVTYKYGYPRVFFAEPLPIPINTVPIWGRVQVYHGNAHKTHSFANTIAKRWVCLAGAAVGDGCGQQCKD